MLWPKASPLDLCFAFVPGSSFSIFPPKPETRHDGRYDSGLSLECQDVKQSAAHAAANKVGIVAAAKAISEVVVQTLEAGLEEGDEEVGNKNAGRAAPCKCLNLCTVFKNNHQI